MSTPDAAFYSECYKSKLKCSICWGPFKNPHAIDDCMHSFCLECIKAYTYCPTCCKDFNATSLVPDSDKAERVEKIRAKCFSSGSAPQVAAESSVAPALITNDQIINEAFKQINRESVNSLESIKMLLYGFKY